ncbi:hypothetical protein FQZ97_322410 [compost metagenome]
MPDHRSGALEARVGPPHIGCHDLDPPFRHRPGPGGLPSRRRRLVPRHLRRTHRGPGPRLAGDSRRTQHPGGGADRLGQDAHGLPLCHRRAGARGPGAGRAAGPLHGGLCVAAQGTVQRHPHQPGGAPGGHPRRAGAPGPGGCGHPHRRAHRRYAAGRARRHAQAPAAHPGHHARIPLYPPRLRLRPRHAGRLPQPDRRRDPRHRRQQAWQPPDAQRRTA